jgi:hypothetical protein
MFKSVILVLGAFLLSGCQTLTPGDEKEPAERPLRLSLAAIDQAVKKGTAPRFKLMIENVGTTPQKVLDLRNNRRVDLQHTYCDLEVLRNSKVVFVPRAISDPGPISDADTFILKPGDKAMFELTSFASAWDRLPPGKYRARVRFWQDPLQSSKTSVYSPEAPFEVKD